MTVKTLNIGGTKGLRNDVSLERFEKEDLSVGANIDIDDTGKISRRLGTTQVVGATTPHSLWSKDGVAFFVEGADLKQLFSGFTTQVVRSDMTNDRVSYEIVNGRVYYTSFGVSGVLDVGGSHRTLGIVIPDVQPTAVQAAGGDMPEGTYLFAVTFVRGDGQESGTGRSGTITLDGQSSIAFSNIPVSTDPSVVSKFLYLSSRNGDVLFIAGVIDNAVTDVTIGALPENTVALRTQYMGPPPAGCTLVAFYKGRLWFAQGNLLWYTEAFNLELMDYRSNYKAFVDPILMIAPVTDGIYIGTDKNILFLGGADADNMELESLTRYGVYSGTLAYIPVGLALDSHSKGRTAAWVTKEGVCFGFDGGALRNVTEGRYTPAVAKAGAGVFKVSNGAHQYLATLFT